MATITVTPGPGEQFTVHIRDETGSSEHVVTATEDDLEDLGIDVDPAAVVEASFRFLLEREPKEAILARFDLPVIARYFPEYPDEIRRRLGA